MYKVVVNYLLPPVFMLVVLFTLPLKNLNTVRYNYIQCKPIFTTIIFLS